MKATPAIPARPQSRVRDGTSLQPQLMEPVLLPPVLAPVPLFEGLPVLLPDPAALHPRHTLDSPPAPAPPLLVGSLGFVQLY